jgi:hypothetical protein
MITFKDLNKDLVEVLKENGVTEKDIRNRYSDLYVGCRSIGQASCIINSEKFKGSGDLFTPQEGSDMDEYPICIDIYFAAADYDYKQRYPNAHLRKRN